MRTKGGRKAATATATIIAPGIVGFGSKKVESFAPIAHEDDKPSPKTRPYFADCATSAARVPINTPSRATITYTAPVAYSESPGVNLRICPLKKSPATETPIVEPSTTQSRICFYDYLLRGI